MNNEVNNKVSGKVFTRVVFLMAQNPNTDMWEPMALFPDLYWDSDKKENVSYQHNGQHGPCCKIFALLDCQVPTKRHEKAVQNLKYELEHLAEPYALSVIDSAEWMAQNAELAREYAKNAKHYEQTVEENETTSSSGANEQMDFMDQLFDDGFEETKKMISEIFNDELGYLNEEGETDYSDLDDEELIYPPVVAGSVPDLMAELKARAA